MPSHKPHWFQSLSSVLLAVLSILFCTDLKANGILNPTLLSSLLLFFPLAPWDPDIPLLNFAGLYNHVLAVTFEKQDSFVSSSSNGNSARLSSSADWSYIYGVSISRWLSHHSGCICSSYRSCSHLPLHKWFSYRAELLFFRSSSHPTPLITHKYVYSVAKNHSKALHGAHVALYGRKRSSHNLNYVIRVISHALCIYLWTIRRRGYEDY